MAASKRRRAGQSLVEFTILYSAVLLPLTFGIIYVSEMYWTWHSAGEFTREGARYASTHCWQPDGSNVVTYMQTHVPVNIDLNQFQVGGSAQINVLYFSRDAATGQLLPFSCDGTCSANCIPDAVSVSVTNYEFRRFVSFLHLPPIVMPSFPVSMAIESAGCDPEQNACLP
ncbi:MAG TPA: TadE family protein [Bryobacteraceae bacterium]|nr:TadE family protein [Bryobacteraceae bacterium]